MQNDWHSYNTHICTCRQTYAHAQTRKHTHGCTHIHMHTQTVPTGPMQDVCVAPWSVQSAGRNSLWKPKQTQTQIHHQEDLRKETLSRQTKPGLNISSSYRSYIYGIWNIKACIAPFYDTEWGRQCGETPQTKLSPLCPACSVRVSRLRNPCLLEFRPWRQNYSMCVSVSTQTARKQHRETSGQLLFIKWLISEP